MPLERGGPSAGSQDEKMQDIETCGSSGSREARPSTTRTASKRAGSAPSRHDETESAEVASPSVRSPLAAGDVAQPGSHAGRGSGTDLAACYSSAATSAAAKSLTFVELSIASMSDALLETLGYSESRTPVTRPAAGAAARISRQLSIPASG